MKFLSGEIVASVAIVRNYEDSPSSRYFWSDQHHNGIRRICDPKCGALI